MKIAKIILLVLLLLSSRIFAKISRNPIENYKGFERTSGLYINEFMANNGSTYADEFGEYDDWIEIYNSNLYDINIEGLFLTDDPEIPNKWQIPDVVIPQNGFILFWADDNEEQGIIHTNFKLAAGGEFIGLYDLDGITAIDSISYSQQYCDISYGRFPNGEENWYFFTNPTPNASNNAQQIATGICINEFMASNLETISDEHGEFNDWIEIYNAGNEAIDIGGLNFTDNLNNPTNWQIPTTYPDSTTIQPGEYLLLWADNDIQQGILHLGFQLNILGEQIGIYNGVTPIDTLTFDVQQTDISYGRLPDGSDNWEFFDPATPAETNLLSGHSYGDVDNDGEITEEDAIIVLQYVVQEITDWEEWQFWAADVDGDEQIMAYDAALIYQYSEGVITEFPVERGLRDEIEDSEITISQNNNILTISTSELESQWDIISYQFDLEVNENAVNYDLSGTISNDGIVVINDIGNGNVKVCYINISPLVGTGDLINIVLQNESTIYALSDFYYNVTEIINIFGNTSIADEFAIIGNSKLWNYPNPFNPSTTIKFNLTAEDAENAELVIYNIKGQKIKQFSDIRNQTSVIWNGTDENNRPVTSGVYFYKLITDSKEETRKMIMVK